MRNHQAAAMRNIRQSIDRIDEAFEIRDYAPPMSQLVPVSPVRARRVKRNKNYRVRNLHWQPKSEWVDTTLSIVLGAMGIVVVVLAWVTLP